MKTISNFVCTQDNEIVSWIYDNRPIIKKFDAKIFAECFKENDAVVVVIRSKKDFPNNAIIFNPDGTEKTKVMNPLVNGGSLGFSDVYFVKGSLALVSMGKMRQHLCVIDKDGTILSISETR